MDLQSPPIPPYPQGNGRHHPAAPPPPSYPPNYDDDDDQVFGEVFEHILLSLAAIPACRI